MVTLTVLVRFNEAVDVTGTPQVTITNGNQGAGTGRGPHLASYLSVEQELTNLHLDSQLGAANAATNADDVLVIGTNATGIKRWNY